MHMHANCDHGDVTVILNVLVRRLHRSNLQHSGAMCGEIRLFVQDESVYHREHKGVCDELVERGHVVRQHCLSQSIFQSADFVTHQISTSSNVV